MKNLHWLGIGKYHLECFCSLNLHLLHWQCAGHGLLQMLARMNYRSKFHNPCNSPWVASWLVQHQTGSQGWIKMTRCNLSTYKSLKLETNMLRFFQFFDTQNLALSDLNRSCWKPNIICNNKQVSHTLYSMIYSTGSQEPAMYWLKFAS